MTEAPEKIKDSELWEPTLKVFKKLGGTATNQEIFEELKDVLNLEDTTEAERVKNRLSWVRTHLKNRGKIKRIGYRKWSLISELIPSIEKLYTDDEILEDTSITLEDTSITLEELNRYEKTLRRKKQIIFAGSPGTGKTFIAQKFAKYLTSESRGFVDLVQFHPAYTYEDFIRGLKPEIKDGHLNYNYEEGRFIKFCEKAQTEYEDQECVFIRPVGI